jgi:poly-gamma-glutamate capsule biosynthesis protein CapA/YwtB (metallophosphatase superfamily)
MGRGKGSRRRNPGNAGGPYRLLFSAICLLFLFFALYAGKQLLGREEETGAKQKEAETALKQEPETNQKTPEKPILRIDTEEEGKTEENELAEQTDSVSLLFAGDIYLSDHVLNAYDRGGGIGGVLDEGFCQVIEQADIFMANQEFPFSSRGTPETDKQFTFRLPEEKVSILQEIGPDIVALANNHALDYGAEALADTIRVLDEAGILHAGAGENLDEAKELKTIEVGGRTFGFLAASRVFPKGYWAAGPDHPGMLTAYDSAVLLEEIQRAKESCDFLTVYVHWGIERNTEPESYQRTLGQQYIDAGADLVIGSHPHVLQGIEYYKGKPIVYSLGNFVFGSSIPKTMLLQVDVPQEGEPSLILIPGTSSAGYTRMLTEESEKEAFYRCMEELSFGISVDETGRIRPKD